MSAGESGPTTPTQHRPLSRHLSTPHLETFRVTRTASSVTPTNNYIQPQPLTSFSTFAHNKSRPELQPRIQDDPNPYSVSRIDELRIQIQDPYRIRTKSTIQLNSPTASQRSSSVHYYQELEDYDDDGVHEVTFVQPDEDHLAEKLANLTKFYKRSSSGGYEIPDTEGSSGGSSEDLPLPPSDTSEEYSHSLSISASSNSDGMSPTPGNFHDTETLTPSPTNIPERDRARIELSLKGRKTEIYVSDSLANLYYKGKNPPRPNSSGSTTPSISSGSTQVQNDSVEWILKYCGVPVLLLDTGETKSRDRRKIQIVLAELGSGLALWKDTIDNLSSYRVVGGDGAEVSTFHTMHLSVDHTKVVGLSFDNNGSADKFWKQVEKLTSDFANISLSGSKHKNKKENKVKDKKKKGGDKWVRPSKNDISTPCGFHHVSSLGPKDKHLFSSLQHFVTGKAAMAPGITTTLPH